MSEFFLCEIENIEKSGVEIKVTGTRLKKCDDDCIRTVRTVCFDFSEHDKVFEDKIEDLQQRIRELIKEKDEYKRKCNNFGFENQELKQRIAELESKETETCEKEPIPDDCRPSMEWYENRHQSDCIEINRLNTTIDVLIHKVEYLRQFAGLE